MNKIILPFIRVDGACVSVVALVEVVSRGALTGQEAIERITRAVTRWVSRTKEGREIWGSSGGELNIGDLDPYLDDEQLLAELKIEGVEAINGANSGGADGGCYVNYDRVLADGATEFE